MDNFLDDFWPYPYCKYFKMKGQAYCEKNKVWLQQKDLKTKCFQCPEKPGRTNGKMY